jgi:hypothetical protein
VILKGQANYLNACLLLISEDVAITPLGSDKEIDEEELEISREGERLTNAEMVNYPREMFLAKGESVMKGKRKRRLMKKLFRQRTEGSSSASKGGDGNDGSGDERDGSDGEAAQPRNSEEYRQQQEEIGDMPDSPSDPIVAEEDRILNFYWDGKGRFLDVAKLTTTFRELEYVENQVALYLDRLVDENAELLNVFKTMLKSIFETEAYIRMYNYQVRHITDFNRQRGPFIGDKSMK